MIHVVVTSHICNCLLIIDNSSKGETPGDDPRREYRRQSGAAIDT